MSSSDLATTMNEAGPGSVRNEGLVRVVGVGALGLGVVNMVVGAGIFVLPGRIAAELGSAAILAYLICSVAVALIFLCFAEVGSRITRSGGAYAYIEEAFGPCAGFIASILLWFGYLALADAAITVAMVRSNDHRVSGSWREHSTCSVHHRPVHVFDRREHQGRQGGRTIIRVQHTGQANPAVTAVGRRTVRHKHRESCDSRMAFRSTNWSRRDRPVFCLHRGGRCAERQWRNQKPHRRPCRWDY